MGSSIEYTEDYGKLVSVLLDVSNIQGKKKEKHGKESRSQMGRNVQRYQHFHWIYRRILENIVHDLQTHPNQTNLKIVN